MSTVSAVLGRFRSAARRGPTAGAALPQLAGSPLVLVDADHWHAGDQRLQPVEVPRGRGQRRVLATLPPPRRAGDDDGVVLAVVPDRADRSDRADPAERPDRDGRTGPREVVDVREGAGPLVAPAPRALVLVRTARMPAVPPAGAAGRAGPPLPAVPAAPPAPPAPMPVGPSTWFG